MPGQSGLNEINAGSNAINEGGARNDSTQAQGQVPLRRQEPKLIDRTWPRDESDGSGDVCCLD
jgi:hypothetical protein